ncbi:MAG: hypothetical protein QOH04_1424 [Sphingomonadales bacterium]|jgi:hypothetical protein|nr:hypothetical protein [Sphingomonadales bacterium]
MGQPEQGPVSDAPEPASEWTSLERAKLAVSAVTPISVLILGALITIGAAQRAEQREDDIRAAANVREDGLRARAAREAALSSAANAEREDSIRRQNQEREDRLKARAEAREDALRRESVAREAAIREQAVQIARYDRLVGKRMELWDRLAPKLMHVKMTLYGLASSCAEGVPCDRAAALAELNGVDGEMQIYHPYFTQSFVDKLGDFTRAARSDLEAGGVTMQDYFSRTKQYYELLRSVRDEFSLQIGRPDR